MIPFLHSERKQKRKHIEHALFQVKYARRMKEDLLDADTVDELRGLQRELKGHLKAKRWDEGADLAKQAGKRARKLHPTPGNHEGLRENVEVFVVVMAVALAFRTYFFQPYQIPTGSMQPTLYGITAKADYEPDWTDKAPARWVKFLLTGSRYREIKAKVNGLIGPEEAWKQQDTFLLVPIGSARNPTYHKVHQEMRFLIHPGEGIQKGQVLARGLQKQGDHIIVNRMITNFRKPRRGDIVVFSTRGLPLERENSAYIKRLTGLPGETLSIRDGKLYADGELVDSPDVFLRQYENSRYPGYNNIEEESNYFRKFPSVPRNFTDAGNTLTLSEDEFLMMGDNTDRSLDGRYFGPVSGENILGIGFFVPWPFFNRGIYDDAAGSVR